MALPLLVISPLVLGFPSAPKAFPAATSTAVRKISLRAPTPLPGPGITSPGTTLSTKKKEKKKVVGVRMSLRFPEIDIVNTEEALYVWMPVPGVKTLKYVERVFVHDALLISAHTAKFQRRALPGNNVKFISYFARIELKDPGRFNFNKMTMDLEAGDVLKVTIPKNTFLLG